MDLKELIEKDLNYQEQMKKFFGDELKKLPDGALYNKNNTKEYYFIEPKTRKRTYISRKNLELLEQTRKSKAYKIGIKRCKENIKAEKNFLNKYKGIDFNTIVESMPKVYHFEMLEHKESHRHIEFEGGVMHPTASGLKVRSKSEVIIVERLDAEGLEFEYEQELILKDNGGRYRRVLPDFTFNTSNGDKIYWEHFGLFKDYAYSRRAFDKLLLYANNDILPGSNLFITADSLDGKIDVSAIYNTIEMIKGML